MSSNEEIKETVFQKNYGFCYSAMFVTFKKHQEERQKELQGLQYQKEKGLVEKCRT